MEGAGFVLRKWNSVKQNIVIEPVFKFITQAELLFNEFHLAFSKGIC
jgi:hypothetical protein